MSNKLDHIVADCAQNNVPPSLSWKGLGTSILRGFNRFFVGGIAPAAYNYPFEVAEGRVQAEIRKNDCIVKGMQELARPPSP